MHHGAIGEMLGAHAEAALPEGEMLFRQFAEASTDVLWIRRAATLRLDYVSPAVDAVYGLSREEALHQNELSQWTSLILPEDREAAIADIHRVRAGERLSFEYRIRRPRDSQVRWLRSNAFPMFDSEGRVQHIGGIGRDITELKSAVGHQQRLLFELQHRVRNTLAVIRSIFRHSADRSESFDEFASHFDGRINAFSRVQLAVTRDPLAGFDLAELIADEFRACAAREGEQFALSGPPVRLKPKAAESIGLAIHELATNAVKHGAFRSERGYIDVRWHRAEREGEPWLCLDWTESGLSIRPVEQKREGFGTILLQRTLPYEFGASVKRKFESGGFRCEIAVPFAAIAS